MASWVWTPHVQVPSRQSSSDSKLSRPRTRFSRFHHQTYSFVQNRNFSRYNRSYCTPNDNNSRPERSNIQLYGEIERLLTDAITQSQNAWGSSEDWRELEGAWVLKPKSSKPTSVIHFIGGIFVGAAPQLTYRLFLERLSEKGILVIATPYASGFDHFFIADEVQFKFDRCLRSLHESVRDLPIFGIGHSLGSVIHLLIGSRYAVQRNGNILMAFNNKEASLAIPLFSPVVVPMAQSIGPLLSQIASSPTVRLGAEMTLKQLENLSPPIVKQVLPLVEQLPPLYADLINGRENFIPKPEETRRLPPPFQPPEKRRLKFVVVVDRSAPASSCLSIALLQLFIDCSLCSSCLSTACSSCSSIALLQRFFASIDLLQVHLIKSYYGVSRNLLVKFKDDTIDETSVLAQVLSSESAISSTLDMSIRFLPGDHGLPLQQALPDVSPAMADAVNRGGELFAKMAAGTPWETVARDVGNTLGVDTNMIRADISKDLDLVVDVITSWMACNAGPKMLRP